MTRSILILLSCMVVGFAACNFQTDAVVRKAEVTESEAEDSVIARLADAQLAAYNRADLDGFCACYHSDVRVLNGETEKTRGIEAFRERYSDMFAKGGFGASVPTRVVLGDHCVDLEHWWRDGGKSGKVLVRYTERDGLIGIVQFLR